MQIAAQYNLIVHQMDVKTTYLHAPLDYEIYTEQPGIYEVKWNTDKNKFVILN